MWVLVEWDWKDLITTILSSGLVLSAITTFYSDFIKQPRVEIYPNSHTQPTTFEVTNTGLAPATNLRLTVGNITNYARVFTTDNYTIHMNSTRLLAIHLPRLATGEGSMIKIDLSTGAMSNTTIYSTYDQGSKREPPPPPNPYTRFLSLLPVEILAISGAIGFNYLFHRRAVKQRYSFITSRIWKDLYMVIKKIFVDGNSLTNHKEPWLRENEWKLYSIGEFIRTKFEDQARFFERDDLTLINNFYDEVISREKTTAGGPEVLKVDDKQIKCANFKVKSAAEKAYKCVKWNKYISIIFQIEYPKRDLYECIGYGLAKAEIYWVLQEACWVATIGILVLLVSIEYWKFVLFTYAIFGIVAGIQIFIGFRNRHL